MEKKYTDQFDIELAVRVYPGISKSPVMPGTKLETFGKCFSSLVAATGNLRPKIPVCPTDFFEMVRATVPASCTLKEHFLHGAGNEETFKLRHRILGKSNTN